MNNIYIKPTQEGWPEFVMKYPVKVKPLKGTNVDTFNELLENDIKDAGDVTGGRSAARCYRTRWDMHEVYPSFKKLSDGVLEVVKRACGPATDEQGKPKDYILRTHDSW